ncbi:UDP-glucuronosyl/UDP-glucosyltransferase [Parasponia andersonii]|uniref:UDP-glucuronosyl/UDP-glucosyltransferase n=1 Tax=Parasponia andersonii TaxID=3476 RepID=A0A2P5AW48_PARAD|nr:UDP-glucuronosyl/UDP-glucosyltransferase [Parasponia andersonii]
MNDDEGSNNGLGPEIELVSVPDGLGPENDRTDVLRLGEAFTDTIPGEIEKLITTINGDAVSSDDKIIRCVVTDVNMGYLMEVAAKMGVKGAVLCTSSAAALVYTMNIPKMLHDGILDSDGNPTENLDNPIGHWHA